MTVLQFDAGENAIQRCVGVKRIARQRVAVPVLSRDGVYLSVSREMNSRPATSACRCVAKKRGAFGVINAQNVGVAHDQSL